MKNTTGILLLFILFGINFGTEPLPPPFYRYSISGSLVCDTLNDKSNFSVLFYAKMKGDSVYSVVTGNKELGVNYSISKVSSEGNFQLLVNSHLFYDSIKVGYFNQFESTIMFSSGIKIEEDKLEKIFGTYTKNTNGGCSSCSTDPQTETIIKNYYYNNPNLSINICN